MGRAPITRAAPYTPHSGKVAGQTFLSERQYRNALAREKGFASWYAQQRAAKSVRTPAQAARLRPQERDAQQRAVHAIDLMSNEKLSLSLAAKRAGTTPSTVLRYTTPALMQRPGGRYAVHRPSAVYRAPIRFNAPDGHVYVAVRSRRVRSQISDYHRAVNHYFATGDDGPLRKFRGKSITVDGMDYPYVTDVTTLERLYHAGEISFEDLYRDAA
ncbi:MAG: hypothetical protein M3008_13910 [Chloroflexota bacterium]|nr:hypothetical protein [Chloroflexota bacterium]